MDEEKQKIARLLFQALPEREALPNMELSRLYTELSKLAWSKVVEDAFADAAVYCMKDAADASPDERHLILQSVE